MKIQIFKQKGTLVNMVWWLFIINEIDQSLKLSKYATYINENISKRNTTITKHIIN